MRVLATMRARAVVVPVAIVVQCVVTIIQELINIRALYRTPPTVALGLLFLLTGV